VAHWASQGYFRPFGLTELVSNKECYVIVRGPNRSSRTKRRQLPYAMAELERLVPKFATMVVVSILEPMRPNLLKCLTFPISKPTQKQPSLVYKSIAELLEPTVCIVDMNIGRMMVPNAVTVRRWQTFAEPFGLFSESIWDSSQGQGSWGFCLLERLWKASKRALMFMS
jgi:hypothetical protein